MDFLEEARPRFDFRELPRRVNGRLGQKRFALFLGQTGHIGRIE